MTIKGTLRTVRKHENTITPYLAWLIPWIIYLISLPPGVTWGDSPELANAAISGGVAHPSGYPLFTLLARVFSWLPFANPASGINLMDAFLEAGAALWIFLAIRALTKRPWLALITTVLFSLTYTFWMHGRIIEVYALNNFCIGAIFYFMIRYINGRDIKHLYIMSVFFGMGFTNHLTTVLFFPAVLFLFLSTEPKKLFRPKPLAIMVGIILAFQLLYLYLPIAASSAGGETIAWNDPSSFDRFLYHVTGKEYSVFRKGGSLFKGMNQFILTFQREFGVIGSFLVIIGALELIARHWRVAGVLFLYFAATVIYNSTYVVQDITTYYMAPYMAAAIAMGVGAAWLTEKRSGSEGISRYMGYAVPAFMIIAAIQLYSQNWDLRYKDNLAHYFSKSAFETMPERSILITDIDGPSFSMWYQAYSVHPKQKGKVVITKGMYFDKNKKWYRDFLRKRHPEVNWPKEGEGYGNKILLRLIENNYDQMPIYGAMYFRSRFPGYAWVNQGWISRILRPRDIKGPVKANKNLRWAYLTTVKYVRRSEWYPNAVKEFQPGQMLGCVAEWVNNHSGVNVTWLIENPQGRVIDKFSRFVGRGEPISAFKMPVKAVHIIPGEYRCKIMLGTELGASLPFTVTP